ncbi:MAG: hypothetical protein EB167_09805, partial [Nitrososphaeria archaeon]|nr:hypothetical protein [Nitrososphaeria archaeon]
WSKGAKVGAAVAVNLIPTGRAASKVSKIVSKTKSKKITSGEPTVKTKTFTQGDRARITSTPPKKTGVGKNSPIKGTKVEVSYKTKKISPETYAMLTTGRTVREGSKKVGTYLKGVTTGAAGLYTASELKKAKDKKEAEKKKKGK